MFRFRIMDAIIAAGAAILVSFLIAASLSLPVWMSSVLLVMVPIGLLAVAIVLLAAPYMVLFFSRLLYLRTNPLREWWVRRTPHVLVPRDHWRTLFTFERIIHQSSSTKIDVPGFRGTVRPEVSTWCAEMIGYMPVMSPRHIMPEDERIRIFVRFKHPQDAFAFKMRWL